LWRIACLRGTFIASRFRRGLRTDSTAKRSKDLLVTMLNHSQVSIPGSVALVQLPSPRACSLEGVVWYTDLPGFPFSHRGRAQCRRHPNHSLPMTVSEQKDRMIESNDGRRELVVLVHGFGAKRALMRPLVTRLRANGFRVLNWNYLSLFAAIETHANRLRDFFATQLSMEPCFHIVAHSMGSIVTRAALNRSSLSNFGRLVLLAPPNAGSPAARLASFFIGRVITPTRELSDQAPHRVPGTDPDPSLLSSIHAASGAWHQSRPPVC
jgi:pimeloyl-ACP methyl ester carboxylesterase